MSSTKYDNVYKVFTNIVNNNKVPHAILFEVEDCNEAMSFIKNIVKLILCQNNDKNVETLNCNNCNICSLIDTNNYPDFKIVETDGTWIKKQQLIDLQDDFKNRSLLNNKRIYVIKEAEKLNTSSSNSLLKFLEEPGEDIVAILVTTNRYLLLDTIISRCQIYNLKKDIFDYEDFKSDEVENFIEYLARKRNLFVYYKDIYENILKDKNTAKEILSGVEKYFLYYIANISNNDLEGIDIFKTMSKISIDQLSLYVEIIEKEIQKLEFNVNFKIWVDAFFSRIIGEVYDGSSSSKS